MANDVENKFKVKLVNKAGYGIFQRVVFHVTPDIIENRNVNYKTLDPIHMPGTIQSYANSSSRSYTLGSIKLISRTSVEATRNLHTLNVLRSWMVPRFGEGSSTLGTNKGNESKQSDMRKYATDRTIVNTGGQYGIELLGQPPAVLLLSAYANKEHRGNIFEIPVIINNLSAPYPSDVDYIPTAADAKYSHIAEGTPFPIIMSIDIQLTESHSPREYSKFSLSNFREGKLRGF